MQEGITGVDVTMDWRKILLLSFALIALFSIVSANSPISIANVEVDVNVNYPIDSNVIIKGVQGIGVNTDFNLQFYLQVDGNYEPSLNDINFNIYLSTLLNDHNQTIATDVNADTICRTVASDTNAGNPGSRDYDSLTQCNYLISTTGTNAGSTNWANARDGNWLVDVNVEVFKLVTASPDLNTSQDINGSKFYLDRTTVTPTIVAPANNYQANGTDVNFTFTANDVNSGVRKYWVFLDGTVFLDSARDGDYTFTAVSLSAVYHTFGILYNDYADNNSAITTIGVNLSKSGGGTVCGNNNCEYGETAANCATDCSSVCGDGTCSGTESALTCPSDCGPSSACGDTVCGAGETSGNCSVDCGPTRGEEVREAVRSKTSSGKPTAEDIAAILTAAGASQNAIDKASEAVGKTNVERTLLVEKVTPDGGKASYESKLTVKVTNNSGKKLVNVKVIENVPKSVAKKASNISSAYEFAVLKDDPILEFNVGEVEANETKEVSYTVASNVPESAFNEYSQPIVSEAIEVENVDDWTVPKNKVLVSVLEVPVQLILFV